jgi:glycosyltransferase involved in cell wall biosynthesis
LVSIITPFYNAEKYLSESISSVLNQSFYNWELLLINDGSTDSSKEIALSFNDDRIRYFEQENKGVSAARNLGLNMMKGEFFCFLDADDILPFKSIESRLSVFRRNPALSFVDGAVKKMNATMDTTTKIWQPSLQGNPLSDLIQLGGKSFFGLSWMIKRQSDTQYRLREGMSHGEDLLFYMELAKKGGKYDYTKEVVLSYRDTPDSAMTNLEGLEKGYQVIVEQLMQWPEVELSDLKKFKLRYRKAMFLSYIKEGHLFKALKQLR